jgi:hypothetical protein
MYPIVMGQCPHVLLRKGHVGSIVGEQYLDQLSSKCVCDSHIGVYRDYDASDLVSYGLVDRYQCFGGVHSSIFILKTEVPSSSEVLVSIYLPDYITLQPRIS